MKIKTKKAAILFWDEERDEPRQILFGDAKELSDFLLPSFVRAYERLQEIIDAKPKSKASLRKAIKKTQPKGLTTHGIDAFDNTTTLHLEYEIKED